MTDEKATAWVTYHDPIYNGTQIRFSTGHEIQYGGAAGDGFCYEHQSFSCVDQLTEEERQAVRDARELPLTVKGRGKLTERIRQTARAAEDENEHLLSASLEKLAETVERRSELPTWFAWPNYDGGLIEVDVDLS